MDPLLALEWHREYLEWLESNTAVAYFMAFQAAAIKDTLTSEPRTQREVDALNDRADREGEKLRHFLKATFLLAETFAVETDMMELVRYAADSLPDDTVHPWTPPSPQGFVLFPETTTFMSDQQRSPIHIRGIAWYAVHNGVHLMFMSDNTDIMGELDRARPGTSRSLASRYDMSHISFAAQQFVPYDVPVSDITVVSAMVDPASPNAVDVTRRTMRFALAFWHLAQQTVALNEPARVPRHALKRAVRAGLPEHHVTRIVRLRRNSTAQRPEGEGFEWHHRWIVRGHWRQQPCGPGRTETRPVWIAAYIKGPDDAPLLSSDKVHHLMR